ncbi:MAG: family 43 glycosylhydrolase [Bacteroidia bacterium]|nr:family 43 glycosylhydrolase [Bacteroidia bacterium]
MSKLSSVFATTILIGSQVIANNPLIPNFGICDSHIHIFDGKAYLYSGRDGNPQAKTYTMPDWRIHSSSDLVNWTLERTVLPSETYLGEGNAKCYATDAAYRNGFYYFYFSNGKDHTTGVLRGKSPAGPFEDPLQKALIPSDLTPSNAEHDPTIFLTRPFFLTTMKTKHRTFFLDAPKPILGIFQN